MGRALYYCGVYDCKNNSRDHPTLAFFNITKDKVRNHIWLKLMGREDMIENPRNIKVCSEHFTHHDYIENNIHNRRLKSNAVPSLNLPQKSVYSTFYPSKSSLSPSRSDSSLQQNQNELISIQDALMQTDVATQEQQATPNKKAYTVGTQTIDLELHERIDKPPLSVANIATQTDFNISFLRDALEYNSNTAISKSSTLVPTICNHCGHSVQENKKSKIYYNKKIARESTMNTPRQNIRKQTNLREIKQKKEDLEMCGSISSGKKRKSEKNRDNTGNTELENSEKKIRKSNRPIILFESDLSEDEEEELEVIVPYRFSSNIFDFNKGPGSNNATATSEEPVPSTSKTVRNETICNEPTTVKEELLADSDFISQFHKWQNEILSKNDK